MTWGARAIGWAGWAVDALGSLLSPPRCAACDGRVAPHVVLCAPCAASAQRAANRSPELTAAFDYGGAIARVLTRFKYEPRPEFARPLADLLWGAMRSGAARAGATIVVPVPLHPSRLAERGFNPSALVAAHIARRLDAPLCPLALERTRNTPTQTALGRAARAANVAGAFAVRRRAQARVAGARVLLIDDVRTTGATLDACAAALADAGAARIDMAVLAVADVEIHREPPAGRGGDDRPRLPPR